MKIKKSKLNNVLEKYKNDENKENLKAKKQMLEYKNDFEANLSLINVLKEQIKLLEKENKSLKENQKNKNSNNDNQLIEMAEKMLKLEKELDKLRVGPQSHVRSATNMNSIPPDLEKKYFNLESEYKEEKQKYTNEITELRNQIIQLNAQIAYNKNINNMNKDIPSNNNTNIIKNNNTINNKNKLGFALMSSSNDNLGEQYNKVLEKYNQANKEIAKLKKKIEKLEQEKKMQKESLFKFKSVRGDEDYEEEINMIQLKEGVRRRNRSEDRKIDFPGFDENEKKYEELENKFNNLKEQLIPILKDNSGDNKNNLSKICNLLGTSVNTTNNILQNNK